jgi:hypothetical protein
VTKICSGAGCTFDAGGSSDSDGVVTGWTWSATGYWAQGRRVQRTFTSAGTTTTTVTVTDDRGASASAEVQVTCTSKGSGRKATLSCG